MLIRKFVYKPPSTSNISMSHFADWGDKCLSRSWRFLLQTATNLSHSSPHTSAECYEVNWRLFTLVWICWHPTAYNFLFLLLPDLRAIFSCAFWVICSVAAFAALWWIIWYLHCCCVPMSDIFDVAPTIQLDLDQLSPGCGGCVSMICWCGIAE